ncbi:40S ribosomal protein S30, partial [Coemansia nantahalensis]
GKVHGSLARAGKVKNQTPKVERQEHAKKATGRAKKREMYNRRIIGPFATVNGKRRLNPAPVK